VWAGEAFGSQLKIK